MLAKYEKFVKETWVDPCSNIFLALSYGGECGELLNEIKKEARGNNRDTQILDELGDNLYYLTRLANARGYTLEQVANYNMCKLIKRKQETGSVHNG